MRPKPPLSSVTILALRKAKGLTDAELGEGAGMSEKMANAYQSGSREPKEEVRERLVAATGCDPGADVPVEMALERACRPGEEPRSPVDPTPAERHALARATLAAGLAWADAAEERMVRFLRARRAQRARRKAGPLWEVLKRCTPRRRRLLIEVSEPYQRWYVAERLAHESEKAASHKPALALELAERALRAAELSPGNELWHSRALPPSGADRGGQGREALAALLLFCNAVRQEWATAELAERLFSYLQRARHDPEMKFRG